MAGLCPFGQPPHRDQLSLVGSLQADGARSCSGPAVPWHHVPMAVSTPPVRRTSEYEFHDLLLPRGTSRGAARRMLTEHAEYGHWELATLRMFPDGTRKITLRRRILRMARTS
jgi:Family of unknown function (DUF5703)